MGDDIGYGHMSAFGGPANTPTFDRIAERGLSYTNFHTTAVCAASRAALLTGRNAHSVGMGCIPEGSLGFPGYNASIPRSAATVFEILRQNGYGTAWVGKTHLTPLHEITAAGPFDRWPGGMGAEYFYGFFGPGVSQWYPPLWENTSPSGRRRHRRRATTWRRTWPTGPSPSSSARSRSFPTSRGSPSTPRTGTSRRSACPTSGSRSTAASSTTVTTSCVTARWRGRRSSGSSTPDTELQPWPEALPSWDALSDLDKKVGARWMEVFCGAVEHTDYQVGRIVDAIEQTGELDNTLIFYLAGDNGPTPEGGLHGTMNKLSAFNGLPESLEDLAAHIDDFGTPKSHGSYPAAWGYATSTPWAYGKEVTSGGGCSTSMVVSWPARLKDIGGIRRQFHHLIDIVPTILEAIGLPEPTRVNGVDQKPMEGVSLLYTFDDAEAADRHVTQYFELLGGRAVYDDGWWCGTRHGNDGVSHAPHVPFDKDVWELYDMRTDFGHANDVAAKYPEKLKELQELFDREAHKYNVYPLADDLIELLTADRPRLVSGNKATYGPGTVRIPEDVVINTKNRSYLDRRRGGQPGRWRRRRARHPRWGDWRLRVPGAGRQADIPVQLARPRGVHDQRPRSHSREAPPRSASTSPTTVAAWARAARARCRSTAGRWARGGSRRPCPSSSRRTTRSMSARTGERRSRRPTRHRSGSRGPSSR